MDARARNEEALRRAEPVISQIAGAFKRKWNLGCLDRDDCQQQLRLTLWGWLCTGSKSADPKYLHTNLVSSLRKYVVSHAHSPNAPDGSGAWVQVVSLDALKEHR